KAEASSCDLKYNQALENYRAGEIDSALLIFNEALQCYQKEKQYEKIGETYNQIAVIYRNQGNYTNALDYFQKALDTHESVNNAEGIAQTYNSMGILYMDWKDYDTALEYYNKSLRIYKTSNNELKIADVLNNIGLIHRYRNNYSEALIKFEESLILRQKGDDKNKIASSLHNIGIIYNALADYETALEYYNQAYEIWKNLDYRKDITTSLNAIGNTYLNLGEYKKADEIFHQALDIAISINNTQMVISLYENLCLNYSEMENHEKFREYYDAYLNYYDSVYNIEKHQQLIELQTQYETEKHKQQIKNLSQEIEIKNLEASNTRLFLIILIVSIFLLAGIGYFMYRNKKISSELRIKDLNQRLLRLQMNPHFIFNSLGAIQEYIYKEDALKAGTYLSNFSKLMRSILEFSKKDYILLSEEIEMLEYYIELQKLRFKNGFKHIIEIDDETDPDFVCIPPMLLQPFVENSIEHGLKKSDSDGEILIQIKSVSSRLEIQIHDNGIGYEESQKNKTAHITHKSRAIEITNERLKALNKTSNTSVKITSRESVGTTVFLKIPLILKKVEK
ncbi:MAG: tetratricopeptide repeat protein, partial [Bacteroidales bacterium]|nr:tetratricopeptide repeat protein [Bacteroidales bacterium]